MFSLGVDLGGTNTAAAIFDENYQLLGRGSVSTRSDVSPEGVAGSIELACRAALSACALDFSDISGIGIGSPGIIDPEKGVIEYWSRYDFRAVPMAQLVEARTGRRVYMENDANAAALGECIAGAGKGSRDMIAVTLGTGIGGGAVIGRKLYSGFNHAALELGHMSIRAGGKKCTCGREGCFEAYASVTALIEQTKDAMQENPDSAMWRFAPTLDKVDGRTSFDAMRAGDAAAKKVVDQYIEYLACGLVNIVNIFQPEVLCVGGGISNERETLFAPVRAILDREDYARSLAKRTRLVRAQLGNDAGLYGAAALVPQTRP